jgi:hypothetical protein
MNEKNIGFVTVIRLDKGNIDRLLKIGSFPYLEIIF